ncbi:hypothetical protein WA026_017305 [Henosepilachna vigintioctopunctata]|uniref:Ion transport domain-containing protein n=1 Tax=Henosepilachna vigintioctopunctata TaxID=420089 RepID=A0AAW1UKN0_9CUCU
MDTHRLSRNNSICPTPEDVLLDLVKTNKQDKVRSLIRENKTLLSHQYPYPYFGKILYVACSEASTFPETVATLLELGADPCDETEDQGEAIHVAAKLSRSNILKVLVKYLTQDEINHLFKNNNALLLLIKEGNLNNKSEIIESAKVLIKSGININHADSKNLTPILWAIKKNSIELIELLLSLSNLDIDSFTSNGKTARELILSKYSSDLLLPNNNTSSANPKDLLFSYLKSNNENAFINFNNGDIVDYKDADNSSHTLLQLSCQLGLENAVKHLIENKSDLKKTTEKETQTPLELAGENGYFEIVDLLLKHDPSLRVSSATITTLLKKMNLAKNSDDKYENCFLSLLKNQDEESLNTQNTLSQTPLHLAVKVAKPDHVLELLNKGASLANKNQFGIMPIEHIDAEVLEDHLDKCVEINDIDKNNIYVTLNYKTLLPSPLRTERKGSDNQKCPEEGGNDFIQNPVPETDAIFHMCKAPHLKYLLTHPIIVTFLLLKWYKIYSLFRMNLIFYTLFLASLLGYVFSSYGQFHYIPQDGSLSFISSISYTCLCVTFVILLLRELFQLLVSPLNYYKDLDNWIEVVLIVIVGSILFIDNPTNDTRKQLSSVAILLSAFELVLMMGQHPKFTTNVIMFKRVSINFMKFLSWYFLLIAAFALSFFILFSENEDDEIPTKKPNNLTGLQMEHNEKKEEETNFFINPGISLFKTLVMLTGEFDASDMNFHSFPFTSKFIFILFVLMIALYS